MRRFAVALLGVSCAFGADFVGNKSCAPCHAAIFRSYVRTPMAQSSGKVGTQDLKESFDRAEFRDDRAYRFLIHDRDSIFSQDLDKAVTAMGVRVLKTPVRAPKQTPFVSGWWGRSDGSAWTS